MDWKVLGQKDLVEHLVAGQALRCVTYTITAFNLTRTWQVGSNIFTEEKNEAWRRKLKQGEYGEPTLFSH